MSYIPNQIETGATLQKHATDAFDSAIVIDKWLSGGAIISTVEVLSFTGDDDLTITSPTKNSSTYTRPKPNESETYSASTVVTYNVAGGTAGTTYRVPFKITLDNGDILVVVQPWEVKS